MEERSGENVILSSRTLCKRILSYVFYDFEKMTVKKRRDILMSRLACKHLSLVSIELVGPCRRELIHLADLLLIVDISRFKRWCIHTTNITINFETLDSFAYSKRNNCQVDERTLISTCNGIFSRLINLENLSLCSDSIPFVSFYSDTVYENLNHLSICGNTVYGFSSTQTKKTVNTDAMPNLKTITYEIFSAKNVSTGRTFIEIEIPSTVVSAHVYGPYPKTLPPIYFSSMSIDAPELYTSTCCLNNQRIQFCFWNQLQVLKLTTTRIIDLDSFDLPTSLKKIELIDNPDDRCPLEKLCLEVTNLDDLHRLDSLEIVKNCYFWTKREFECILPRNVKHAEIELIFDPFSPPKSDQKWENLETASLRFRGYQIVDLRTWMPYLKRLTLTADTIISDMTFGDKIEYLSIEVWIDQVCLDNLPKTLKYLRVGLSKWIDDKKILKLPDSVRTFIIHNHDEPLGIIAPNLLVYVRTSMNFTLKCPLPKGLQYLFYRGSLDSNPGVIPDGCHSIKMRSGYSSTEPLHLPVFEDINFEKITDRLERQIKKKMLD